MSCVIQNLLHNAHNISGDRVYESKYFRELLICIFANKVSPSFVVQGLDVNRRIFKEPKCVFLSYK